MRRLAEQGYLEVAAAPADINGAGIAGDWMSLKGYNHCTIVIAVGNLAGDAAVTLDQAQDVSGTGSKTLGFTKRWSKANAAAQFAETAVASDTFTLLAASDDNSLHIIEIDASDLDVANGFDCLQVDVADPAAAALVTALYFLSEPRYGSKSSAMVNPKVN